MKTVQSTAELHALALRQGGTVSLDGARFNTPGLRLPVSGRRQVEPPAKTAVRDDVSVANIEPEALTPAAPPVQGMQQQLGSELLALLMRALPAAAAPLLPEAPAKPKGWSFEVIRNDAGRLVRLNATPTF